MALLNTLVDQDKLREKNVGFSVVMVHYSKLIPSESNNYSTDNIKELANAVLLSGGIKQNLLVRKKSPSEYELIAGHRRRLAIKYLVEELGREEFSMVPVHVEKEGDLLSEIDLILTNCTARDRSDWEKMMEVSRLTELIKGLQNGTKEEQERFRKLFGVEPGISGRELRKVVAQSLGLSETKVANLNHIDRNLNQGLKSRFQSGEIGISVANAAAALSVEDQEVLSQKEKIQLSDVRKNAVSDSDTGEESSTCLSEAESTQRLNVPKKNTVPVFTSELSNAYGCTWNDAVRTYLTEVHRVRSGPEDRSFPEAVFSSYGREYQASVNEEQVAFLMNGEVQFIVNMDRLDQEYNFFYPVKEKLSAYGTKKRIYPPDSLIATQGCEGGHDCFSCAMECEIRGEDRYCREAPMGNPFPCEHIVWGLQALQDEIGARCQFVDHDLADHCAGSGEADPCCKNCVDPCEYICSRAMRKMDEQQETEKVETAEAAGQEPEDNVIDAEYTEVADTEKYTAQYFLRDEQKKLNEMLEVFKDEDPEKLPKRLIARQKIIVAALAAMVCDLEEAELQKQMQRPRAEQPEFPAMRNNDQRREFLNTFHDWPVWFRVPEASEVYYRYDLPDQTALVICEYRYWLEWKSKYGEDSEGVGTREYLLIPGYHYLDDCRSNRSAMVEKLKGTQKQRTKS